MSPIQPESSTERWTFTKTFPPAARYRIIERGISERCMSLICGVFLFNVDYNGTVISDKK